MLYYLFPLLRRHSEKSVSYTIRVMMTLHFLVVIICILLMRSTCSSERLYDFSGNFAKCLPIVLQICYVALRGTLHLNQKSLNFMRMLMSHST